MVGVYLLTAVGCMQWPTADRLVPRRFASTLCDLLACNGFLEESAVVHLVTSYVRQTNTNPQVTCEVGETFISD